jgi:hypothetical protein
MDAKYSNTTKMSLKPGIRIVINGTPKSAAEKFEINIDRWEGRRNPHLRVFLIIDVTFNQVKTSAELLQEKNNFDFVLELVIVFLSAQSYSARMT